MYDKKWITSFVETVINVGNNWQSYEIHFGESEQKDFYKPLIVQVGVGEGSDTLELTDLIQSRYDGGKLVAIDWFAGNISTPEGEEIDAHNYTQDDFIIDKRYKSVFRKLKIQGRKQGYDAFKTTTLIKGNSHTELLKFEDESIDVLFIDGGHEYSVVKKDIEIGWKKVIPGGYICGDDYSGDYHLNKINEVSEEDLEKDTIEGLGYIELLDNNGYFVNITNVHAGVIKSVYDFFDGKANINNWGRYWYYKKVENK